MTIDLIAAEKALLEFRDEVRGGATSINVELWNHQSRNRTLEVKLTLFDRGGTCQQVSGITWEEALAVLKARLAPRHAPEEIIVITSPE